MTRQPIEQRRTGRAIIAALVVAMIARDWVLVRLHARRTR